MGTLRHRRGSGIVLRHHLRRSTCVGKFRRRLRCVSAWKSRCTLPGARHPFPGARALLARAPCGPQPRCVVKIRVLGSAAGGGFPQWNCNCRNCCGRARRHPARPRPHPVLDRRPRQRPPRPGRSSTPPPTSSRSCRPVPCCSRRARARDTAIAGIVLVDGADRPHHRPVHAARVHPAAGRVVHRRCARGPARAATRSSACSATTAASSATRCAIDGSGFEVAGVDGVQWRALAGGRASPRPISPHRERPQPATTWRWCCATRRAAAACVYAPGLGVDGAGGVAGDARGRLRAGGRHVLERRRDDRAWGSSKKRARDMGHLPQSGAGGMLEWLARLPAAHAQDPDPREQHQPDPRRGLRRARELDARRRSRWPTTAWRSSCERARAWSAQEFEAQLRERGRAYHIHHPFNVMLNTGKREPRADPRLGGEPLLLPDQHPAQGRRDPRQLRRPRRAAQLGAAHPRSRRLRRRPGRHRVVAAAGRGGGA